MAGERLSKLTIEATFSLDDNERGAQSEYVRFRLAGAWIDYYRGGSTQQHQYTVPDPDDVGRDYVKQAVENLLALVRLDVQSRGLPYVVSATRDLGNTTNGNLPRIQFDIEAAQYSNLYDLDFWDYYAGAPKGWTVVQNLKALLPFNVQVFASPATIYGSATGGLYLLVTGGNTPPFTYAWADDPTATSYQRQNLKAGTYTCLIRDADGVSTTVQGVVTSDAQLQVLVQQTETSISLAVSGGLAPYAVQWDDGPTDFERQNLAAGTYAGTVTDARGASQRVTVVLLPNRCYFSQNPVPLVLDAGAAYRLDPTTKPNLSFVCEVWLEQEYLSGVFAQVGPTLEQPADALGRTTFWVQALLDAFVGEHLPPVSGELLSLATGLFKRFYLRSAEKYGAPPAAAALTSAQQHYVLLGGLSQEEAAAGTWPAYQAQVLPFLTWEPDYQRVLPAAPAYLYYQHAHPAGTIQLRLRPHLVGNLSAPEQVLASLAGARRHEVYCLRVGPAELGLGADVAAYDVWVSDEQGAVLSQVRHFLVERAYYPQARHFLYTNSLGGLNVLTAVGTGQLDVEMASVEAERPAYVADLGDVATLDRTGTPTLKVATGPRRRAQVMADQELLYARRVTLLRDGVYWPGRVAAATFRVKNEDEGLASLSFDFVLAKQRHFSPRLPVVAAGQLAAPVAGGEGAQP